MMRKNTIDDFWAKVDCRGDDECWPWTRFLHPDGYGRFKFQGRGYTTQRFAYMATYGLESVPVDRIVLHSCDNPACCNPRHLRVGTDADNVHDAMERGRRASMKGERSSSARLTEIQVRTIRERHALSGVSQAQLSREYGVDPSTIGLIVRRKTWKEIE